MSNIFSFFFSVECSDCQRRQKYIDVKQRNKKYSQNERNELGYGVQKTIY